MTRQRPLFFAIALLFTLPLYADQVYPKPDARSQCCSNKGSVQYCDSSAGRYVCSDGDYSSCYCTRRAIMDLQKIEGCCLWQGGVMGVDHASGLVVCNNGGVSEMCSIQHPIKSVSLW